MDEPLQHVGSALAKVRMLTPSVNTSSTMLPCSTPRIIGWWVQLLTISIAGTVSPIVDNTDPRKMLTERCIWFASAARVAPIASGVATSTAITSTSAFPKTPLWARLSALLLTSNKLAP